MSSTTTSIWNNASGGSWSTKAAWNGVVPNSAAVAALLGTLSKAYTVTSGSNETVEMLTAQSGATLSLTSGVFDVDNTAGSSDLYDLGSVAVGGGATLAIGPVQGQSPWLDEIDGSGKLALTSSGASWATLADMTSHLVLKGGGAVSLAGHARIVGTTASQALFENVNDTISGFGTIGNGASGSSGNSGLALQNDSPGTIDANGAAGQTLVLDTGATAIENAGLLESTGVGGLTIDSAVKNDGRLIATAGVVTVNNANVSGNGDVMVGAGAELALDNSGLGVNDLFIGSAAANGGLVTTTAGNTTHVGVNGSFAGDWMQLNTDNFGTIAVVDNSTLNVNVLMVNEPSGIVKVMGKTATTTLEFCDGGGEILGGSVVLSDSVRNQLISNGVGANFQDYSDLSGSGVIGDGWLRLDVGAAGVVNSNGAAGLAIVADTLAMQANSESANTNDGLVETTGAGGLTIGGAFVNGGVLLASGAGALTLNGAEITSGGGRVEAVGDGRIVLEHGAAVSGQSDATISAQGALMTTAGDVGALADTFSVQSAILGTVDIVDNSTLIIGNPQVFNSGKIAIEGVAHATTLEIAGGQSLMLNGTGVVDLEGADSSILTAGPGAGMENYSETIEGAGRIGDSNMSWLENGFGATIDATGASGLAIDSNWFGNGGTVQSDSAGGLAIEQSIDNAGELVAKTGNIVVGGSVYGGGEIDIDGVGSVEVGQSESDTVVFGGGASGALILDHSAAFSAQTLGFGAGDSFDLRDFAYIKGSTGIASQSTFNPYDASLQLTNGATVSVSLDLQGDFLAADLGARHLRFSITDDGHEIGTTGLDGTKVTLVSTSA
ncbi:hypothetical protein DFR50_108169 [Roseiarcus fermentans]|uniref:Uncharacterized protein n=1 Tax=Roseiarcus fermentans TaxID=1473586 RepID=A0A366FLS7_9HYPH|nr:hypothetical protein [Roseiarcus fermentans]RBP15612.1 hypothetical protein DFR50_108169 [Roseiarcus fermentans]